MKKSARGLVLMMAALVAMFCFSSTVCFAGEVKLSKNEKAEIAKTFTVMWKNCGNTMDLSGVANEFLIRFGIINSGYVPKKDKRIPAKYAEVAVKKYFNKEMKHESVEGFPYVNGFYHDYAGPDTDNGDRDRVEIMRVVRKDEKTIQVFAERYKKNSNKIFRLEEANFRKVGSGNNSRYVVLVFNSVNP